MSIKKQWIYIVENTNKWNVFKYWKLYVCSTENHIYKISDTNMVFLDTWSVYNCIRFIKTGTIDINLYQRQTRKLLLFTWKRAYTPSSFKESINDQSIRHLRNTGYLIYWFQTCHNLNCSDDEMVLRSWNRTNNSWYHIVKSNCNTTAQ